MDNNYENNISTLNLQMNTFNCAIGKIKYDGLTFDEELKFSDKTKLYLTELYLIDLKCSINTLVLSHELFPEIKNIHIVNLINLENLYINNLDSLNDLNLTFLKRQSININLDKVIVGSKLIIKSCDKAIFNINNDNKFNRIEVHDCNYNDGMFTFNNEEIINVRSVYLKNINFDKPLIKSLFNPTKIEIGSLFVSGDNLLHLIDAFNVSKRSYVGGKEKVLRLKKLNSLTLKFNKNTHVDLTFVLERLKNIRSFTLEGLFTIDESQIRRIHSHFSKKKMSLERDTNSLTIE